MRKHVAHARRPKYRTPDQQIREQDARRLEIREQASTQSIDTGCDEAALLEALVIQEAIERSKGEPDRGLMIFDIEMEMIQQDQARDALEQIIAVVREAADEYRQDPERYVSNFAKPE